MYVYSVLPSNMDMITKTDSMNLIPSLRCNNLLSYWYYNPKIWDITLKMSKRLFIDSGSFTFFGSNNKDDDDQDFEPYFQKYLKFVKKNTDHENIVRFIELDIGVLTGMDQVYDFRSRLEEVSDKIIPVYHSYMGINEYKKMVKEYDYIAIGGIVIGEIDKKILPQLVKYASKNNCKIHALGLTDQKLLKSIPFYSVDSSSYCCRRFGQYFTFVDGNIKMIPINNREKTRTERPKIDLFNYINNIKMQKYYENYWKHRGY